MYLRIPVLTFVTIQRIPQWDKINTNISTHKDNFSKIQNRLKHDISVQGWADCWIISGRLLPLSWRPRCKGGSEFKVTPLRFWWWQWYLTCGVMVIIFYVCPVPDKRHLMTKMSSTLRRSENCRRGRKSRVSSQSAAGDLYCAIISTLCTSSRKTPSSLNALQYKKQPSLYCFTTNQCKTWL